MQRLEVSGAVRPINGSLGIKRLREAFTKHFPVGILEIKFNIKDAKPHQKKWWY